MIRSIPKKRLINFALLQRGLQAVSNMSGPVETSIRMKISSKLSPEHLDVINESYMHNVPKGTESHFKVVVVSSQFENKPLIQRHRMVNEVLNEEFENGLHALSIVAKTPSQWADSDKKLFHSDAVIDLTTDRLLEKEAVLDLPSSASKILSSNVKIPGKNSLNVVHILEPLPVKKLVQQDIIAEIAAMSDVKRLKNKKMAELMKENGYISQNGGSSAKSSDCKQSGDHVDACTLRSSKKPQKTVLKEDIGTLSKVKEKNDEKKSDKNLQKVKDGNYFLKVLDEKVKTLEEVASVCEGNIDLCHVEESKGELRSVAGKARLLVSQKFKQFRGLCNKNLTKSELDTFPTTNEDLQGFWDMISLQYDEIMNKYESAKMMKENDWKMPQKKINKVKPAVRTRTIKTAPLRTIQPIKPPQPIKNKPNPPKDQSEVSKACEAARKKMLQDCKLAMKQLSTEPSIEIN